jgi:hypothetical protein
MPLDFPNSPTNGQIFTSGTKKWEWNLAEGAWHAKSSSSEEPWLDITGSFTEQTFNASTTWAVPSNTASVEVLVIGGGGGASHKSGGGGGGGMSYDASYSVTPGASIPVTVGAFSVIGGNGNDSQFGTLLAQGGRFAPSFGAGGAGGTGNYANGATGANDFGNPGNDGPVSPFDGLRYGGSGTSRAYGTGACGYGGNKGLCPNSIGLAGTANSGGGASGQDGGGGDSRGGSGVVKIRYATNGYTAVDNDRIAANTSGGAFSVFLPPSPANKTSVTFLDHSKTWDTENLTIARNGSTIEGLDEDFICNIIGDMPITFLFDGTTWRIYAQTLK